jgi:hypothetical protein
MRCRAELLALLVYVTLDLSLPAMPGAFVFEPADSVESAGGGRQAVRGVALPTPVTGSLAIAPLTGHDVRHRWLGRSAPARLAAPSRQHRPRARGEPAPSAEDAH